MKLDVENTGDRAVPDLAVTVETEPATEGAAPVAFGEADDDPTLAASARPVWVVDEGPAGGDSAYVNTWAVGPLGAGRSRTVTWKLTAVRAGRYTVAWRLAPALEGDVELEDGRTTGEFAVDDLRRAGPRPGGRGRRGRPRRLASQATANATSSRWRISRASPMPARPIVARRPWRRTSAPSASKSALVGDDVLPRRPSGARPGP